VGFEPTRCPAPKAGGEPDTPSLGSITGYFSLRGRIRTFVSFRPPAPEAGALTKLSYTQKSCPDTFGFTVFVRVGREVLRHNCKPERIGLRLLWFLQMCGEEEHHDNHFTGTTACRQVRLSMSPFGCASRMTPSGYSTTMDAMEIGTPEENPIIEIIPTELPEPVRQPERAPVKVEPEKVPALQAPTSAQHRRQLGKGNL
jgi:hypothetical protein